MAVHEAHVRASYDALAFNRVYAETLALVTSRLSALYLDIVKDRVYADARTSHRRRSAQTTLHQVRTARRPRPLRRRQCGV